MGVKCCSGQATCKAKDDYYSQCVASITSDATMVVRRDAQFADVSSLVGPALSHWQLTLLLIAGMVFLATLVLGMLAVHRRLRRSNQGSLEDGSPMLSLSGNAVP